MVVYIEPLTGKDGLFERLILAIIFSTCNNPCFNQLPVPIDARNATKSCRNEGKIVLGSGAEAMVIAIFTSIILKECLSIPFRRTQPFTFMAEALKPILSPEEAGKYLPLDNVVVLDARGGADAYDRYQSGHLDGAIFLDLETQLSQKSYDASQGGRHPLPPPHTFGKLLGSAGINPNTHVLVYDDKAGANAAARCWWMLRASGHTNVQVIDGGLDALAEAGLKIARGPSPSIKQGDPYPVEQWSLPVATLETVDAIRSLPDHLVIDVRERYRYSGEKEPIDLIAGHIPGAVNVPYPDNLRPDGRFRTPDELAAQYNATTGERLPENVIVHCGSGVTACHTLLAMEIAGIKGASLYVGSWSEWSRRSMPVARGENP